MALADIVNKIKADADVRAAQVKADEQKEAERILKEGRKEADRLAAELSETAKARAEQERGRVLTIARLESRKRRLSEKQNALDRAFAMARSKLVGLPDQEYLPLAKRLIMGAAEEGEQELIASDERRALFTAELMAELNTELGDGRSLTLSDETRALSGGFVLRKGRHENNLGFDTIMGHVRERCESEVAQMLFGDGST